MLKKILIGLGIIVLAIAALFGYAATKSDVFVVERSISIKAAPEKVYAYLEDLHKFVTWSPFEEEDPDIKRVFSGAGSGDGAIYDFESGKIGKGSLKIIDAKPPFKVVMVLHFVSPIEAQNVASFTLTPKEEEETKVTWSLTGRSPLFSRALPMFFSMDKMVGPQFEKGLTHLKTLAEK